MSDIVKAGTKSWRTTLAGILIGAGMLLTQVGYVFDSDPLTNFDMGVIPVAFGLFGLGWFARDNKVTSEEATK